MDFQSIVVKFGPRYLAMLGYGPTEIPHSIETWLSLLHPDERESVQKQLIATLLKGASMVRIELRMRAKAGHYLWILGMGKVMERSLDGAAVRVFGTHLDITATMEAQRKLKNLEAQLYQSRKMEAIGTLAGGIAHDFNNILTAILGFSELAKLNVEAGGQAMNMIDQVIISGRRAAELVRQILSFSRNEPQKICLVEPHIIVSEVLKLLHSSLPATVKIEENIDSRCGKIKVDPIQFHQVVMNICTNALHSMSGQKGILKVKLYQRLITTEEVVETLHRYSGKFVVLSISDTGCGIDSATIARIFEPYFTTKNVGEGTGLGLAVVHSIVESYNGFIEVESEIDQGTTFNIYLPVFSDSSSTDPLEKRAAGKLATGTEHILLVDDEKAIVDLQTAILTRLGYKITAINHSAEALTRFRSAPEKYDLIITDQSMPGLSGAELAAEILKIRPTMPVIICTGYSSVVNKEDALAIGIKQYLEKPVAIRELAQVVRLVLDESLKS